MADSLGVEDLDLNGEYDSSKWQDDLQKWRLRIADNVVFWKISPYLQAYGVFDQEDYEEVSNSVLNPTNSRKMNKVIDKLLRKGEKNYEKFLVALSFTNPELYDTISDGQKIAEKTEHQEIRDITTTGKLFDISSEVFEVIAQRYESKREECEDLVKQLTNTNREIEDKAREISQLEVTLEDMKKRSERYESMERDITALKDVLDQVKNENYKNCMRLVEKTEENARLRERNMAMRIEMDRKETDLKKANRAVDSEKQASFRLRRRIQDGPSQKYVSNLLKEIEDLKIQLAQSRKSSYSSDGDIDTRIQMLRSDKEEAIQMCAEASEKLNKLREEFNEMEITRDKHLEENERLTLQLAALTDDCDMFKNRRDAVWQQLQEVEKERDQLMKERNDAQISAQNHMDEKTKYRAEIRNLEENLDKKSLLLREKEKEIRKMERELGKHWETNSPKQISSPRVSSKSSTSSVKSHRPRCYITKYYAEFDVTSEFGESMSSKSTEIGPDNEFPEIPKVANYGKSCGNFTKKWKRAIRRQHKNSDAQSRTSSTDSEKHNFNLS